MNRRSFLATVPLALGAKAFPVPEPLTDYFRSLPDFEVLAARTPTSANASQDLDFATALQAASAIRKKQVSSVELTRRAFGRIDRHNPQLNALPTCYATTHWRKPLKLTPLSRKAARLAFFTACPLR